jgi:CheY-like chemotaxis protein
MRKILILEDDFDLAMHWKMHLEELNYIVIHTGTFEEAKTVLSQQDVDVIVSDILIRESKTEDKFSSSGGLSLLSFTNLYQYFNAKPKFIAVSGSLIGENVLKHAAALNADRTMIKPVTAEELGVTIQELLQ